MADVENLLRDFFDGKLNFEGLQREIELAVATNPGSASQILATLQKPYDAGRIPHQLYVVLKTRICAQQNTATERQPDAAAAQQPEIDPDNRTRIRQPAGQAVDPIKAKTDAGDTRIKPGSNPGGAAAAKWDDPSTWSGVSDAPLEIGSTVKGRFVLEVLLGSGGMGKVFKARDLRKQEARDSNPYVAMKVLNENFKHHPDSLVALQRECLKTQNLAHPNIVNVFDFDRDGAHVFMTMEYLQGAGLDELIRTKFRRGVALATAWPIIRRAAIALLHAHENQIAHLDFKPGNVFVTDDGNVKVLDLGIARAVSAAKKDQHGKAQFDPADDLHALTPPYASCEMLEEQEPDPRDDIYALACVTYELITGRHPFGRVPANEARDQGLVPEPIVGLKRRQWKAIEHALAFNREDRTASITMFVDEFEGAGRFLTVNNLRLLAIGTILTVAIVGTFLYFFQPSQEKLFIDEQLAIAAANPPTSLPDEMVQLLMEQGRLYLEEGEQTCNPLRLSEGPDNANSAFKTILEATPSREAAESIWKILAVYEKCARDMIRNNDIDGAQEMVKSGRKIYQEHAGLQHLANELGLE